MYLEDFMKPLPIFLLLSPSPGCKLPPPFHPAIYLKSGEKGKKKVQKGGGGDPTDVGLSVSIDREIA